MKRLGFIALIAMFSLVACTKNPPSPVILPDVTITGPDEVFPDKTGTFTATLNEAAKEDMTIKVTNAHPALLTIAAAEIIIEKGKTVGNVKFTTTKNSGHAKVSFTSADATVKTPELMVMIPIVDPPFVFDDSPIFSESY